MLTATPEDLKRYDTLAEKKKKAILEAPDAKRVLRKTYYVSNDGNDANDGLSPDTAWATCARISTAALSPGDGVLFRRGDIFRGRVLAADGVFYGAFGSGEKPRIYGWDKNLADERLWTLCDEEHSIWKLTDKILDVGTLVFNEGEAHSVKLIPSYINGRFVCRDDESKPFRMENEAKHDLDIYWHFDTLLTTAPSKGEAFPIPEMCDESFGELYIRCDAGNPGAVFSSIEALPRRHAFKLGTANNVSIDNLCIKYIGLHAIGAEGKCIKGLSVTNCEIGWIGGTIQHYLGTDPNYPQGGRGTVTRYGNAIEIYGGCKDYVVENCYIYQVYDAGITHQVTTWGKKRTMENVRYSGNLIERCVYSIEYFLEMNDGDDQSFMDNIEISDNILRFSGYGWGQQRHNKNTPAHIKGWSYENKATRFRITGNIFDRAAFRMLHLVAKDEKSCPTLSGNTFIQYIGGKLGQYGENCIAEPENLDFDEKADDKIHSILKDAHALVLGVKRL